jgi:hypothetical protein
MGKNATSRVFALSLQVVVVISFLMLFFVLYARRVEDQSADDQINFVVDHMANLVDPSKLRVNTSSVRSVLNKQSAIIDKQESGKNDNSKYIRITLLIIAVLIGGYVLIYYIALSKGAIIPFDEHIAEAVGTVLVVAAVEIYFLVTIIENYISPNDAMMVKHVGAAVSKYAKNR